MSPPLSQKYTRDSWLATSQAGRQEAGRGANTASRPQHSAAHSGVARGTVSVVSRPPSVLHVVQSGDRGGVQRHVRDLADGLADITAGVAVGTTGWLTTQLAAHGIAVSVLPYLQRSVRPDRAIAASVEIALAAQQLGATIIHAHGVVALAAALRGAAGRPLIYTPHGFQWRDPAQPVAVRAASFVLHRWAVRRVARLVAVSRQDASDALLVGFRREIVHRIPNGVPAVGEDDSRRRWNTVGVAARLVPGKGLETLVRALAEIPEARLVVAGSGPLEPRLRREATRVGVTGRVEWWGWQESLDIFYRTIAVYAAMSQKEGLPYSVLDALAYGVPVVGSDIPAHRELIRHVESAVLVPVGDVREFAIQLRVLLGNAERRKRIKEYAASAPQAFALADMLTAHRKLYREPDTS